MPYLSAHIDSKAVTLSVKGYNCSSVASLTISTLTAKRNNAPPINISFFYHPPVIFFMIEFFVLSKFVYDTCDFRV